MGTFGIEIQNLICISNNLDIHLWHGYPCIRVNGHLHRFKNWLELGYLNFFPSPIAVVPGFGTKKRRMREKGESRKSRSARSLWKAHWVFPIHRRWLVTPFDTVYAALARRGGPVYFLVPPSFSTLEINDRICKVLLAPACLGASYTPYVGKKKESSVVAIKPESWQSLFFIVSSCIL